MKNTEFLLHDFYGKYENIESLDEIDGKFNKVCIKIENFLLMNYSVQIILISLIIFSLSFALFLTMKTGSLISITNIKEHRVFVYGSVITDLNNLESYLEQDDSNSKFQLFVDLYKVSTTNEKERNTRIDM